MIVVRPCTVLSLKSDAYRPFCCGFGEVLWELVPEGVSEGLLWVLGPWKLKELFPDRALATLESIRSSRLHWFVIRVVEDWIGLPCWSCCIFPKRVINASL